MSYHIIILVAVVMAVIINMFILRSKMMYCVETFSTVC